MPLSRGKSLTIVSLRGMVGIMSVERVEVLLSLQRALWEQVTPNLRGVAVAWRSARGAGEIAARFLYDGSIGELERECVSLAETQCCADFLLGVTVAFRTVENATRELLPTEEWIYLRHEPDDSQ